MWSFPQEILRGFESIEVLTYLFEGSLFWAYLRYYGFGYIMTSYSGDTMPSYVVQAMQLKKIRGLITVYEGKLNNFGREHSLSLSWYKGANKSLLKQLKTNTVNFFRTHTATITKENAYSVFSNFESALAGKNYTRYRDWELADLKDNGWVSCFIAINAKATNNFSNKKSIAYLVNRFYDKAYIKFFAQGGIALELKELALSELVQLVFRGVIRNEGRAENDEDCKMTLYIPSLTMRLLFNNWLQQTTLQLRNYMNRRRPRT
jgi:hypothetical protein